MTATASAEPINPQYRQGDVFLIGDAAIPAEAIEQPRDPVRGVILQAGTATGHHHRIGSHAAKLFIRGASRYLRAVEPVDLVHDEHTAITLPAGDYQIVIHHEYVPGAVARQVED
jgi:hypothetical protein